jgi:hypothetical protein
MLLYGDLIIYSRIHWRSAVKKAREMRNRLFFSEALALFVSALMELRSRYDPVYLP